MLFFPIHVENSRKINFLLSTSFFKKRARIFGRDRGGGNHPCYPAVSKGAEPRNPQLCKLINRTLIYFQSGSRHPSRKLLVRGLTRAAESYDERRVLVHACTTDPCRDNQGCGTRPTRRTRLMFRWASRVSWDSSHLVTTILFVVETLLVSPFILPNNAFINTSLLSWIFLTHKYEYYF